MSQFRFDNRTAVGGSVRRIFLAQTRGIQDRQLNIETVAERWNEITAADDAEPIECATIDLTQHAKAYPHRGEF